MSYINFIHLSEVSDKKNYDFKSFDAIGGTSVDFGIKRFELSLTIQDAGDGYYVKGALSYLRELPCTLCNLCADLNQAVAIDEFIRIDPSFDADSERVAKSDESDSLVLKTPVWDILAYIQETISLEEPTQFYPNGQDCKSICPNYLDLVKKGILVDSVESKKNPAFETLKNFQFKG